MADGSRLSHSSVKEKHYDDNTKDNVWGSIVSGRDYSHCIDFKLVFYTTTSMKTQ